MQYDLIAIGSDVNAAQAATQAAKLGKRAAWIPQSGRVRFDFAALRDAVLLLTGFRHRQVAPEVFARRRRVTLHAVRRVAEDFANQQRQQAEAQQREAGVDVIAGTAQFIDPHHLEVRSPSSEPRRLSSRRFVIGAATRPIRPAWVPFDGRIVCDSDEVLTLDRVPKSMIVVGNGIDALRTATLFGVLGTRVAIIDARPGILNACDRLMARQWQQLAQQVGVRFRMGRAVASIERTPDDRAAVRRYRGTRLLAECVVYAGGRTGDLTSWNLEAAGLMTDEQGRLWCNEHGQTWSKHIYGVGDIVGFPTSASLSIDQPLRVVAHAFGIGSSGTAPVPCVLPLIPEVAMVGATEEQLQGERISYVAGIARFVEPSRGLWNGSRSGLLKLLLHRESRKLLGVHCLSETAAELIRLGQTVMSLDGTVDAFTDEPFRGNELSDCYRQAALAGLRRMYDASNLSCGVELDRRTTPRRRRAVLSGS